jgi:hypothetical protein
MMAMAPSWHGAQMAFLGSLYMDAMGLQMQQSMPLSMMLTATNKLFAIAFVLGERIKMNGGKAVRCHFFFGTVFFLNSGS